MRETPGKPRLYALLALVLVAVLAGCAGNENTLAPHSHAEHKISELWWVMLAVASFGFLLVVFLLFLGWVRRNRESLPFGGGDRAGTLFVVGLGIAMPLVLLTALFVWSDVFVIRSTAAPLPGTSRVHVTVTGRQWFWDVQYPGTGVITANEIHIPVRTRVDVTALTGDVIHDLWIPELNRKIDMIPGQRNHLLLVADRPGTYDGRCGEFCGLQHAHMEVFAIAESPAKFHAWLHRMAAPARTPTSAGGRRGLQVFLRAGCAACHQIRGTAAQARVGPDLTHFASRMQIAAGTLPNNRGALAQWIRDPQHEKPGAKMPALHLTNADLNALVSYLESLK